MKLSYLGPPKTFSEKAAKMLVTQINETVELFPWPSVEAVAHSLIDEHADQCDLAVLPYYNYLEGLVQECMDLIYEHHLCIIGAKRTAVEWAIGKYNNKNADTDKVYSHSKALAQCSEYLWTNYPRCNEVEVSSTAEGAMRVQNIKSGMAIASFDALKSCKLEIIAENIGNKRYGKTNFTDFYLISSKECQEFEPDEHYMTMIAVTPQIDRSGLLAEILNQIAYYNLNNAKIHSRPALVDISMDVDPQMFYLEIMCHRECPDFIRCIDSIKYRLTPKDKDVEVVRVLGSYTRPSLE